MEMKCVLLLWCAAALQAGVAGGGSCAGPVIGGVHYTDEVLYSDKIVNTLDYYESSNVLYFTTSRKLFKIDLYSKELVCIGDLPRQYAPWGATLDPKTGDLYLGTYEGVYKYEKLTNKFEKFGNIQELMSNLFFKDILYLIDWVLNSVFTFEHGYLSIFEDLNNTKVNRLLIDNDDYMIFSNQTTGLYGQKRGTRDAVLYEGTENVSVLDLNMNVYGDVYAAFEDGVYAVDKQNHQVYRILSLAFPRAIAFDLNNNIIYTKDKSIRRLTMSDDQDCV